MCSMCVYCVCACCVCGLQNGISGACKDKTVGMCSWSNVKQTGSLPLPKSGANGDMYVREALPQASAHLLPGLCEQNGVLRGTARPGPLVGPRSPALAVFGTPRSSPLWREQPPRPVHRGSRTRTAGLLLQSLSSVKREATKRRRLRSRKPECQEELAGSKGLPLRGCGKPPSCGGLARAPLLRLSGRHLPSVRGGFWERPAPPVTGRGLTGEWGAGAHACPPGWGACGCEGSRLTAPGAVCFRKNTLPAPRVEGFHLPYCSLLLFLFLCLPHLPGASVHGISKERILAWVAISFSRGSSPPRDRTQVYLDCNRIL